MLPILAGLAPYTRLRSRQPLPMSSPVIAAATRSQNVLRLRAATRSSRSAIGSQFMSQGQPLTM